MSGFFHLVCFQSYLCWGIYQNFILLWLILHWLDRPPFLYSFIRWQTFGIASTFWLVWIMLPWAFMYELVWLSVFSSLGYIRPRVALLGHMVIVRLTFWGTARLFSSDGFAFTWNLYSFHKCFYKKMNFKKPQPEAQHCLWGIHPGHTLQGTPFSESSLSCPSLCP